MRPSLRSVAALLLGAALAVSPVRTLATETRDARDEEDVRPNILLIMFEDMSPRIGVYGDPVARTPVLDSLAKESILFDAVFTTAGVCAPSRAALITGRYQQSIGAQHMRTSDGGPIPYEAVPPSEVKAFPELLRRAGYYTTNNGKTDYQFGTPFTIWDEQETRQPWNGRTPGQPFFAMVNIMGTHESRTWPLDAEPLHPLVSNIVSAVAREREGRVPVIDPGDVIVPPYLPDTPAVRRDLAQLYENIAYCEKQVAELLVQLEKDGLADSTIVIVTTDHGDGLPRMKRSLYDSGLHVPMMVRFPDGTGAGMRRSDLVSFVDLAPTILSLAHAEVPAGLPGRVFVGPDRQPAPDYVFAAMDRHDEVPDRLRAIRDIRWKYIRNYQPEHAFFRHLDFRDVQPTMQELWRLHEEGGLTPVQESYFTSPRSAEELYDTRSDPHEINNLADDPAYAGVLSRMRTAFDEHMSRIPDMSAEPEAEMIAEMWPSNEQPVTAAPEFRRTENGLIVISPTEGTSIGYRIAGEERWRIYTGPLQVPADTTVEAKAIRYGYKESSVARRSAGR